MATFLKESYFTGTNGSHFKQRLYYDLTQDKTNNKSTIKYYAYVGSVDNYSGSGATASVKINGNQVGTFTSLAAHSSGTLRGTYTTTVTHNSDGTKSVSYSLSTTTSWSLGSSNLSGTLTLPKIARAATVTSAPNFNDEENPTIKYSNPAGNSVSSLMACISLNGTRDDIAYRNISKTGSSYTFNLTEDERNVLRNACTTANSRTVRFYVRTVIGGSTLYNYATKTLSIINANPVFSDFTFADVNSITTALTGNNQKVVKGYSKVQATISTLNKAVGQKGTTITKYRLTIGDSSVDISYNDEASVTGTIDNAQNGTINIYAIDSRSNSTLVTKLASEEINYEPVYVNINNSSFQRDDNRVGDNGVLTLNGTFWNSSFGTTTNSLSVSYRFKKSDSSTWINGTTTITPTVTDNNFTFSGMLASDNLDTTWDLESSYDLEITVTDELSTSITTYILASAIPTLSLDKEGVGVMCQYNTSLGGGLQVYGQPVTAPTNEMIKDITITSNQTNVELTDLNIVLGENYKFRIVGCAASSNADIYMTINDITGNSYYMAGRYDNGTGTTSDASLTQNAGYRPTKARFYYSLHLSKFLTVIDGTISIKPNIQANVDTVYVEWQTKIVWNGHQNVSNVVGVMAGDIDKITKIKLANATFKAGTRIQLIKVNGDFTI